MKTCENNNTLVTTQLRQQHDGNSRDSCSPNVTGDGDLEDEDGRSSSVPPSSPRMDSETDRPLSNNMSHQSCSGSNDGTSSPGSR